MIDLTTLTGLALILPLIVKLIVVHTKIDARKGFDVTLVVLCILGLILMIGGWVWG